MNQSDTSNIINLTESFFLKYFFYNLLTIICLTLLSHIELKYKLLSTFFKKSWRAADFFAFLLINLETLRFIYFIESIIKQEKLLLNSTLSFSLSISGFMLLLLGLVLLFTSFRHLGLRGMYFGDHFGYKLPRYINTFPYDIVDHPQYIGVILIYLGFSIWFISPIGVLMSIIQILSKVCLYKFESTKLEIFYPETFPFNKKKSV